MFYLLLTVWYVIIWGNVHDPINPVFLTSHTPNYSNGSKKFPEPISEFLFSITLTVWRFGNDLLKLGKYLISLLLMVELRALRHEP